MRKVREFHLEILRHGPAHNQLLSPLTLYMALCGSHDAETVHVPFEHRQFLERLKDLRYVFRSHPEASSKREQTLRQSACEMSAILGAMPGLVEELAPAADASHELIHLRLVISAAELALLPFELADSPRGCPGAGDPLFLQTVAPITITREVRRLGQVDFKWPRKARILFAAAAPPGVGAIPLDRHVLALRRVIEPWVYPYDPNDRAERNREVGHHLTILPQASLEAIQEACAEGGYTHVHLLAHGAERRRGIDQTFGIALHKSSNSGEMDVVDGRRLATALRAHRHSGSDGLSHPAVVTIASCDSGNVGSVVVPGASIAHDLHKAGIPLVVASQFPLTFDGSELMVRVLYERLLRGDDPRIALHDLRWQLHTQNAEAHDWASLVAYAALPADLSIQLDECRYQRAKQAINAAMARADWLVQRTARDLGDFKRLWTQTLDNLDAALKRLPDLQSDPTESEGIRASNEKRKAQTLYKVLEVREDAWKARLAAAGQEEREALEAEKDRELEDLDQRRQAALARAREHYFKAFNDNLSSHWTGVQYLSMTAVLGHPIAEDLWTVNRVAAERDLRSPNVETVAWAHGSLLELYLLAQLLPERDAKDRRRHTVRARQHARKLLETVGPEAFHVSSTRRQLQRYTTIWKHLTELQPTAAKALEELPEKP